MGGVSAAFLSGVGVLLLSWGFLALSRANLSFVHMTLFFLSVQYIAVIKHCMETGHYHAMVVFSVALVAYAATLAAALRGRAQRCVANQAMHGSEDPLGDAATLWLLYAAVATMVTYHYAVGGIPLLSQGVEIERFDATTSGIFGIPGRLMKFGMIYIVFLAVAYAQIIGNRPSGLRTLELVAYGTALIALVFSGFKSSVLVLLQVVVIVRAFYPPWRVSEQVSLRTMGLAFSAGLGFVIVVAALYARYREVPYDAAAVVLDRIFYISGWPFAHIVNSFVPTAGLGYGEHVWRDIHYVAGIMGLKGSEGFNTVQMISADMHGKTIGEHFIVPVTMNLFGQAYLDFGIAGAVVSAVGAGGLSAALYARTFKADRVTERAFYFYLQLALFVMVTKGNAVYELADRGFTVMVLAALLVTVNVIGRMGATKAHGFGHHYYVWRCAGARHDACLGARTGD